MGRDVVALFMISSSCEIITIDIVKKKRLIIKFDAFVKSLKTPIGVIPAKAGIQYFQALLDACLRRHDRVLDFLRDRQV